MPPVARMLFPPDAPAGQAGQTLGVLSDGTIGWLDVPQTVSAFDNLTQQQRNDATSYTASLDVTAPVQSIANALAGANGGLISVPPCKLQLNGLVLPTGVGIVSEGWRPRGQTPSSTPAPYQIYSPLGPWAIDTPSAQSFDVLVAGLSFVGPGASPSVGGVRFQNMQRGGVMGCSFNNFSEWGILQLAGAATVFEHNTAWGCLLDRTRSIDQTTLPHGVIEIRGNDAWVIAGEYNASLSGMSAATVTGTAQAGTVTTIQLAAGSSSVNNAFAGYLVEITSGTGAGQINFCTSYAGATVTCTMIRNWATTPDATSVYSLTPLKCLAGAFKGTDAFIIGGQYELSDAGLWLNNIAGVPPNKLSAVGCDQNWGHGTVVVGNSTLSSCSSQRSSKSADGAFDDVLIIGGGASVITGQVTGALGSDVNQPRHGIHDACSGTNINQLNRTYIHMPSISSGQRRGKLVKLEQTGFFGPASRVELAGGALALAVGTTPSLDGWKTVALRYGSATTITQFTDLIDGVTYTLIAQNANTTIANNANIILRGGANVTLATNQVMTLVAYNGILIQPL